MSSDTNESVPHSFVFEFASKEEYLEFVKNFPSGSFDDQSVKTYDVPGSVSSDYISLSEADKMIATIVEHREQQHVQVRAAYEATLNVVRGIVARSGDSSSTSSSSCCENDDDEQACVIVSATPPPAPSVVPTTSALAFELEQRRLVLNAEISKELFAEGEAFLVDQQQRRVSPPPSSSPPQQPRSAGFGAGGGGGKVLPPSRLSHQRENVRVSSTTTAVAAAPLRHKLLPNFRPATVPPVVVPTYTEVELPPVVQPNKQPLMMRPQPMFVSPSRNFSAGRGSRPAAVKAYPLGLNNPNK
jgi:hypothetical protein